MLLIQAFLKFTSIGIALALCALIIRDGRHIRALQFGVMVLVAVICHLLGTGSPEISVTGNARIVLRLIDMPIFVFIWWFGLALFDDEFKLGTTEWLSACIFVMAHLPGRLYFIGFDIPRFAQLEFLTSSIILLMMSHLVYVALAGHREDLVESRRKMRKSFAFALALLIVVTMIMERIEIFLGITTFLPMMTVYFFTLPLMFWAILWVTQLHPEKLAFSEKPGNSIRHAQIDPRDNHAHQRLMQIMQSERAFTEHGLTIGKLSERVGLPPHQLRTLINQSMGYRNYTAFLNHYRIEAVKNTLSDPEKARTPVLTLALEAGFSSLAPFNKAFKDSEGITPTQYRQQKLSGDEEYPAQN